MNELKVKMLESLPSFIDGKEMSDFIRTDDYIFHNILEYCIEDDRWGIGCYSNGYTQGWIQVYTFPNSQDIANSHLSKEDFLAEYEDNMGDSDWLSLIEDELNEIEMEV